MDIFHAIVLSIIEGVTEFLPVSSTGHMILTASLFKIPETEFLKSFEIIIQLGAILAVVSVYIKVLLTNREVLLKLLAAFIPTAVVGFILYKFIKQYLLGSTEVVLWSLFIGGIILIAWEKFYQKKNNPKQALAKKAGGIENLSYRNAAIIGLFQSISVIPGVSRAAATIIGAMTVGLSRKAAVEFSFLLAVPTMVAATGLDLIKTNLHFSSSEWGLLAIGLVGAFITALASVRYFLKFVTNHTFVPFGVYRVLLALLFWLLLVR